MIDTTKLIIIVIQSGAFIAAIATIAAGIIMISVTKKFGTGILASGFKTNATGIFIIALGIITDAIETYIQISSFAGQLTTLTLILLSIKHIFFVIGTYIIVIGSKKTADNLQSLTK